MQTEVGYEYVQDKFKPLETLRNVEFNRDWSLPFDAPAATENLINGSLQLSDQKDNYLKYAVTNYNRSDNYNGIRNAIENVMAIKGLAFYQQILYNQYQQPDTKRNLFKAINRCYTGRFRRLKNLKIGGGLFFGK